MAIEVLLEVGKASWRVNGLIVKTLVVATELSMDPLKDAIDGKLKSSEGVRRILFADCGSHPQDVPNRSTVAASSWLTRPLLISTSLFTTAKKKLWSFINGSGWLVLDMFSQTQKVVTFIEHDSSATTPGSDGGANNDPRCWKQRLVSNLEIMLSVLEYGTSCATGNVGPGFDDILRCPKTCLSTGSETLNGDGQMDAPVNIRAPPFHHVVRHRARSRSEHRWHLLPDPG